MAAPDSIVPPGRFAANVLLPIAIAMAITMLGVGAFVFWSTTSSDMRASQREARLIEQVLAEKTGELSHQQESVTVWDDAMIHVVQAFDSEWYEGNIGYWMFDYFGHDETILLDPDNIAIAVSREGLKVHPAEYSLFQPTLGPLVDSLRAQMRQVPADQDFEEKAPPFLTDAMLLNGIPALVSIAPMVNSSTKYPQVPGREFVLISIIYLNAAYAEQLGQKYQVESPSFSIDADLKEGYASVPIRNDAGRFVAFFEWHPDRPGTRLLTQTAPALVAAFLLAAVTIALLLHRLKRYSQTIEDGRRSAEHQATHDILTGLPNRHLFEQRLIEALANRHTSGKRVALLMLDLDRFKQVNDTHGHQVGDHLIREVAVRLVELIGGHGTLARLGGDEFGVVLPSLTDIEQATLMASAIVETIAQPFYLADNKVFVGMSIGISFATEARTNASELTRMADIALYEAKSAGRNQAVVFQDQMRHAVEGRAEIEGELREALRRTDQLSIDFQPLYDAESGLIVGAEALARWNHPTLGRIPPMTFIPVAESSGLIEEIGDLVLHRACMIGAFWPGKTIAVNISPIQLRNPRFSGRVLELLANARMHPSDLELEITENILLADDQTTVETLRHLRAAGVRIALDDFGTGYSSLGYLRQYAVDRLKIDRSFVIQIAHDAVSRAVVEAMITLAHAMGAEVTAEGVETDEQHRLLRAMGCNTFQGYFFSPPVKTQAIEAMLRDQQQQLSKQTVA